jgi:hypothetical protein
MEKFEDILDLAINELKKGSSPEMVFSKWPEHKTELEKFLQTSAHLLALPKNKIPTPSMQRKYLQVPVKTQAWFAWLHVSRFAGASVAAILLITGMATTAYGAMQSLPGQPLFSLKKTVEQIQLHFASNDIEKANLQMKITKERLADAQAVFSSPNTTSKQQVAVLNELTDQTNTALQVVKSATESSDKQSSHPLADSLQAITHQQQDLLTKIDSGKNTAVAIAGNVSDQDKAIKQFRQMVATTNEQATIIALKPDPNAVIISGPISHIDAGVITIDKTSFTITSTTVFKDVSDQLIKITSLSAGGRVTVVGSKNASSSPLIAKEILMADSATTSDSQTQATSTPASQITATSSSSSATSLKKVDPTFLKKVTSGTSTLDTAPPDDSQPNPSKAVGTFIPEDPSPQFNP